MQRRTFTHGLIAAAPLAALAGCGFQLRQPPVFAFQSIRVGLAENSLLGNELRRQLGASGLTVVSLATSPAQVLLEALVDVREKAVVGSSAAGQVREFALRVRFRFRLRNVATSATLIDSTELLQERSISYSESAALAKEAEEQLLYRDMQSDIVQQTLRRLAAVKSLTGIPG